MKCNHCGKEVEEPTPSTNSWVIQNLIGAIFILYIIIMGAQAFHLLPQLNVEGGYTINWDMAIILCGTIFYGVYLGLYSWDKVKGRFVIIKKGDAQ